SGGEVATLMGVCKRYGEDVIYGRFDFGSRRGERWCVMGVYGAGKTTLLKMVAGVLQPDSGEVRIGASVKMGYFSQAALELLDPKKTVWEQMDSDFPTANISVKRNLLGAFEFPGDE